MPLNAGSISHPSLLRMSLLLTQTTFTRPVPPLVVFSHKVRSLIGEIPFWEAFGTASPPSHSYSPEKKQSST